MKLLVEVSEASWPASEELAFRPLCAKFVATREGRRFKEVWALLELVEPEPDEGVGVAIGSGVVREGATVTLAGVVPLVAPVAAMRAFRSV